MNIPYHDIDLEMVSLIRALNKIEGINTTGCCIGHKFNPIGNVILSINNNNWNAILVEVLKIGLKCREANIDIMECHRLNLNNKHYKEWKLNIVVHPRNDEVVEDEEIRLLRVKKEVIKNIVDILKVWESKI